VHPRTKIHNHFSISAINLLLFSLILLLSGCGSKQGAQPQFWPFQPKAVKVHVQADPKLNLFYDSPHTLVLCLYQLTDPNGLNILSQSEEGISQLLACNRFDSSVASFRRLVVQPAQEELFELDRAEGARYVALVAGYYELNKDKVLKLYKIPVVMKRKSMLSLSKEPVPGELDIELYLGPYGMRDLKETKEGE